MSDQFHPELAGGDPDDRPVRHPMMQRTLRIVVMIGLVALVVPGILVTVSTQMRTADAACGIVVDALDRRAVAAIARFEFGGPEGPGWYCYGAHADGSEVLLQGLGLIPGLDRVPTPGTEALRLPE